MVWSKLCKSNWNCAWNLAFPGSTVVSIQTFLYGICVKKLHYESVHLKELHNEQEYYWPKKYGAGAAVVSTIPSNKVNVSKVNYFRFTKSKSYHSRIHVYQNYILYMFLVLLKAREGAPPRTFSDSISCNGQLIISATCFLQNGGFRDESHTWESIGKKTGFYPIRYRKHGCFFHIIHKYRFVAVFCGIYSLLKLTWLFLFKVEQAIPALMKHTDHKKGKQLHLLSDHDTILLILSLKKIPNPDKKPRKM